MYKTLGIVDIKAEQSLVRWYEATEEKTVAFTDNINVKEIGVIEWIWVYFFWK